MRNKYVLPSIYLLLIVRFLTGIALYTPSYKNIRANTYETNVEKTQNTVRINGNDPIQTSIYLSQIVYPATLNGNRPNAVILVRDESWQEALLATTLINQPIDSPILYIKGNEISVETLDEIRRLNPKGLFFDNNKKVILIGDVNHNIVQTLNKENISFRHIKGENLDDLATKVDQYRSAINANNKNTIIVVSKEDLYSSLIASTWNAHSSASILFVTNEQIPKEAKQILNVNKQKNIYVLGTTEMIPVGIVSQLSEYGYVQRIAGQNEYEFGVEFAQFGNLGYKGKQGNMGVNAVKPQNYVFVNHEDPLSAIAASVLSTKGKQGSLLYVDYNNVPNVISEFLEKEKPTKITRMHQLSNQGWIIGNIGIISINVQNELNNLLSIKEDGK